MDTLRKSFRRTFSLRYTQRRNRDYSPRQKITCQLDKIIIPSPNETTTNESNSPQNIPSLARFIDNTPIDSEKNPDWQQDERLVRQGKCQFKVKFVGYIEVKEARGMETCEDAVKELKRYKRTKQSKKFTSKDDTNIQPATTGPIRNIITRLSLRKRRNNFENTNSRFSDGSGRGSNKEKGISINSRSNLGITDSGKRYKIYHRKATLTISPDSLRVHEDHKNILLVDQTIEKVSFCAPDTKHHKSFSYICRDGTTRKWWCYSFSARKGIRGDRLSHAVGCAFNACLKRKKDLEKIAEAQKVDVDKESSPGSRKSNKYVKKGDDSVKSLSIASPKEESKPVQSENEKSKLTEEKINSKFPELQKSFRKRPQGRNPIKAVPIEGIKIEKIASETFVNEDEIPRIVDQSIQITQNVTIPDTKIIDLEKVQQTLTTTNENEPKIKTISRPPSIVSKNEVEESNDTPLWKTLEPLETKLEEPKPSEFSPWSNKEPTSKLNKHQSLPAIRNRNTSSISNGSIKNKAEVPLEVDKKESPMKNILMPKCISTPMANLPKRMQPLTPYQQDNRDMLNNLVQKEKENLQRKRLILPNQSYTPTISSNLNQPIKINQPNGLFPNVINNINPNFNQPQVPRRRVPYNFSNGNGSAATQMVNIQVPVHQINNINLQNFASNIEKSQLIHNAQLVHINQNHLSQMQQPKPSNPFLEPGLARDIRTGEFFKVPATVNTGNNAGEYWLNDANSRSSNQFG